MSALLRVGYAPGSPEEADWHQKVAQAVARVEATMYAYVHAATGDPLTPLAPIPGAVGVVADVEREHPGWTARAVCQVSPEWRAESRRIHERIAAVVGARH